MGGRVRNLAILETLAGRFELEILILVHDRADLADPGRIGRLGRLHLVLAWNRRGTLHRVLAQAAYRTSAIGWGRESWFLGARATASAAARILRERPADAVHMAYWYTLRHLRQRPRPPLWILDTHDVQFERTIAIQGRVGARERSAEIRELERSDVVVAITPRDAERFRSLIRPGKRIETIGMGVDLEYWKPPAGATGLAAAADPAGASALTRHPGRGGGGAVVFYGYLGSEPNRSSAVHLCREILPALRALRPEAEVILAGADPAPEVVRLGEIPGVRVTGPLEDPRPLLASCSVMVLPLRAATGIRSRACEVMGLDVPLVAYAEAIDGMGFVPEQDFLLARDPDSFARQIIRLMNDPALSARIAQSARAEVAARFGIRATYGRFIDLYEDLIGSSPDSSPGSSPDSSPDSSPGSARERASGPAAASSETQ